MVIFLQNLNKVIRNTKSTKKVTNDKSGGGGKLLLLRIIQGKEDCGHIG